MLARECEQNAQSGHLDHRGKYSIEVLPIALSVTVRREPRFELLDRVITAGFDSEHVMAVQQVASWVLAHRLVKNYKAESEGISTDGIIKNLL